MLICISLSFLSLGGAIFVAMALTPFRGCHGEKDSVESWNHRTTHTGDDVGYYEFDQRFEHPGRTWASVGSLVSNSVKKVTGA